jgi:DNA-binding transcriptional LysR family regulator
VDLRQLEIFVKVAELGSFSKAADALFLTQPTVSEHIKSLEDELGVRLLDRLGRGAAVTKGGALLQGYAQRLLALSREARQAMESFQGRMSGELLVGASTIPGEYILPALIGRFKEKFPDIAITLLIGGSQAVTEWVAEGRAEVGVVGARSGHRGIDFRELLPDDIVLIVGVAHPWHGRKQVAPSPSCSASVAPARGRLSRPRSPRRAPTSPPSAWSGRWARPRPSSRR